GAAVAQAGVGHGAQDGGLPAGGPQRGAGRARGGRAGGPLHLAGGLHLGRIRNHGGARMTTSAGNSGRTAPLRRRWSQSLLDNYGTPPLALVRGEGCVVFDEDGKSYLDLLAGIAVNALGHAHPAV